MMDDIFKSLEQGEECLAPSQKSLATALNLLKVNRVHSLFI